MPTKEYIQNYRKKRKQLGLEMLGGKCCKCNSEKDLQFDHIDPRTKVNEISSMFTTNIEVFVREIHKCQLLCYPCRLKKSLDNKDYLINRESWKHGKSGYINHKCRCEICKKEYHEYCVEKWQKTKNKNKI